MLAGLRCGVRAVQVSTSATGRSWLMWAFIPASANWIGSIPAISRRSASGRQASGTAAGSPATSDRSEVQVGEFHVQLGHERGDRRKTLSKLAVHLAGHIQVHAVEARERIGCRHTPPRLPACGLSPAATEVTGTSGTSGWAGRPAWQSLYDRQADSNDPYPSLVRRPWRRVRLRRMAVQNGRHCPARMS